jgi:uncharacterized membrane protein
MAEENQDQSAVEDVQEKGQEAVSGAKDLIPGLGQLGSKQVLIPLAATGLAVGAAALATRKGPDALSKVSQKAGREGAEGAKQALADAGNGEGIAGKMLGKAFGGGGGGKGGGKGKTRRLPIQRWTDVAVPREKAYEMWTDYEKYPEFMHRVLSVQLEDEDGGEEGNQQLTWEEKIWFSKRQWKAEIVEERENEMIAWKTISGTGHTGLVTFHEVDDNLTRVLVTMDFQPSGMMEKMASGLRFVKRAVQADLARFKAHAEMDEAGLEEERMERQTEGAPGTDEKKPGKDEDKEQDESDEPSAEKRGREETETEDDEDRDAERREREQRREARREKVSA